MGVFWKIESLLSLCQVSSQIDPPYTKTQLSWFVEQVIEVVQADPAEIYHLEWETEPESEYEESSFAHSEHSADSLHYTQPRVTNIADELARCRGNIDASFVEVLFNNRGKQQKFYSAIFYKTNLYLSNEILLQRTQASSNGCYQIFTHY